MATSNTGSLIIEIRNDVQLGLSKPVIPSEMSEAEALALLVSLEERFGWAVAMFTRGDADTAVPEVDDPLTDDEWEQIRRSRGWLRDISEVMVDSGWDMVFQAVNEVLKDTRGSIS